METKSYVRVTPQIVLGIIAIAAGEGHTCAVTGDGAVKCWGDNEHGQLGLGWFGYSTTPVDVFGGYALYLPLVRR